MQLISIIIPAYNAERYLRASVDTALAQTYEPKEVVVVDDGSTDGTGRILAEYGDRIRVITQGNGGSSAACNAGVAAARGRWVAFLDADDEWLPNKLALQFEQCGASAISHTDSVCFGDGIDGEVVRSSFEPGHSGHVLNRLLVGNFITKSSVMMLRDVYLEFGGFPESELAVEDWPFFLKVCARYELGYLPQPVVRYRVHATSKSMQARRMMASHLKIIDDAFAPGGVGATLPSIRKEALVSSYQINCHYASQMGDWAFAARCASNVIARQPGNVNAWKSLVKALLMPLGYKY
jgi:glycosyltransferase involved in cell wall biosynthesis